MGKSNKGSKSVQASVQVSQKGMRGLVRPRAGFEPFAAELIQLAVNHPELQGKGFNAQQLLAELQAYMDAQPRVAAAESQLNLERTERLSHGSLVWLEALRIYHRVQAETPYDRELKFFIARFEAFMKNKPRAKKATPVTTTPVTTPVATAPVTTTT